MDKTNISLYFFLYFFAYTRKNLTQIFIMQLLSIYNSVIIDSNIETEKKARD